MTTKKTKFFLLKCIHMAVTTALFYVFWMLFRYNYVPAFSDVITGVFKEIVNTGNVGAITGGIGGVGGAVEHRYDLFVTIGYAVALYLFNRTYNTYLLGFTRIRGLAFSQFISQFFSGGVIYLAVSIGWLQFKSPHWFFVMLVFQLLFDCIWSVIASIVYFHDNPPKRTIFIYRDVLDKVRFGSIAGKPVGKIYKIEKELQYRGLGFQEIRHELEGYEAVFVAGVSSRCRNGILKYCIEEDIPGFFLPHVGDVLMRGALHIQTFTSPVMYFGKKEVKPEYLLLKRMFDFTSSLLGLVVLSPLMLVLAWRIRHYDGGPALYKQTRLTKDGKEFEILKFRSMKMDAESDGVARLSTGEDDDRITPIGKFMRKYRFDEFPQLINILRGDMSIVGPRPERPEIAKEYYETIPDFRLRLQIKAGLTGYAQVYGKYNTNPYEKLEFDLLYINDMSFLTDLRLIFATFSILGNSESVQGVMQQQGSLESQGAAQKIGSDSGKGRKPEKPANEANVADVSDVSSVDVISTAELSISLEQALQPVSAMSSSIS